MEHSDVGGVMRFSLSLKLHLVTSRAPLLNQYPRLKRQRASQDISTPTKYSPHPARQSEHVRILLRLIPINRP